jgi:hypothetical protein
MSSHDYPDTTTIPRVRGRVSPAVIERQRIPKAVRGLPVVVIESDRDEPDKWLVDLDAVLEIIDGQP